MSISRTFNPRTGIALAALAVLLRVAFQAESMAPDGVGDGITNSAEREVDHDGITNARDENSDGGLATKGPHLGELMGKSPDHANPAEKDCAGATLSDDSMSAWDMDGDEGHDDMLNEDDIDGDGYEDDDATEMDTASLWFNSPEERWPDSRPAPSAWGEGLCEGETGLIRRLGSGHSSLIHMLRAQRWVVVDERKQVRR